MKRGILVACSIVFFFSTAFAGPNLNPGKWEITTKSEMIGGPAMNMPAMTHTQCLKEENAVPRAKASPDQDCRVTDVVQKGDTVSWKIICAGQTGEMEGTGKVTYSGDTMSGTMKMEIKDAGMQIKNTINGRRIGDCD